VRNNFMILCLRRKSLRKLTHIDETQADGGWVCKDLPATPTTRGDSYTCKTDKGRT
jgi:hypothetical protein